MKSPTMKQGSGNGPARRGTAERRAVATAAAAEALVAEAMTDALEHILAWERASERSLKIAEPTDVSAAAS